MNILVKNKRITMKTVLKVLLATVTVMAIILTGVWGIITFSSDTDTGWKLLGWLITILAIVQPSVSYWYSKLEWLLDLKD
jgi:hypothetical protein